MTRNDFVKVVKTMILSMACALPIVLIISFLIAEKLSSVAITFLDAALLISAGILGYFVQMARENHIKKKRAEYLASLEREQKREQKKEN